MRSVRDLPGGVGGRAPGARTPLRAGEALRRRSSLALLLVAALTVVAQLVVQGAVAEQEHDARVINLAGRQRMHSQQVAKLAWAMSRVEPGPEADDRRAQLEASLSSWQRTHRGLLAGDVGLGLPGRNSPEVVAQLEAAWLHAEAMLDAAHTLLSSADATARGAALSLLSAHEPRYLQAMDAVVARYEVEARHRVAWTRWLGAALLLVTLVVLALESLLLFAPMSRGLEREMETRLAREQDLQQLFEASPTALLLVDRELTIVGANQQASLLLGFSWPHPPRGPLADCLAPAAPENERFLARLRRREVIDGQEAVFHPARGPALEVMVSVREVRLSGQDVLALGLVDITERKQLEQQLRVAATAFESQEGMFITDAQRRIVRVNRAFCAITGYSPQDAIGQTPRLLRSGQHDAAFYTALELALVRTGAWQGEIWNRRKNGEVYPQQLTITAVRDDEGALTHYVATLVDITQRKAEEREIAQFAFHDPLTNLPNRRLLLDRVHQALVENEREQFHGALLFIDLDHFKQLNDTFGHDRGDLLLKQVAERLARCVRRGDTVARLGGDEFVVLVEHLATQPGVALAQARSLGDKILAALNEPYELSGLAHGATPSIGVTVFGAQHESIDELMKRADLAMYEAKAAGRNTVRFFIPDESRH